VDIQRASSNAGRLDCVEGLPSCEWNVRCLKLVLIGNNTRDCQKNFFGYYGGEGERPREPRPGPEVLSNTDAPLQPRERWNESLLAHRRGSNQRRPTEAKTKEL
jgi:hypothetical protein